MKLKTLHSPSESYGKPNSLSIQKLRECGFNPIAITIMLCEESFVFETEEESQRAHDEFENNPKHEIIIQGWWYDKECFKKTIIEYFEQFKSHPVVYWLNENVDNKMKIDINTFKIAPKTLYSELTLCVYGEVEENVLNWADQHKVAVFKKEKYTNFVLPANLIYSTAFLEHVPFEWLDGFSPNLNKKLHIGHFSNLVLGKAFKELGICNKTVSIYGDTLTGDISNEEGLQNLKIYQEKFNYKPSLELMASKVKLEDDSILIDGEDEYKGTKVFNINEEKIVAIKSNGQTTYFYQDVALASKLNASTLYLTGAEQENHFKNLKELYPHIHHISLGLVKVSGKKMGTRFGNVILIEDFINQVKEYFGENHDLIYNVFAGFILQSNPEVDKKINLDIINNPKNSKGLYISYTMARLFSAGCEPIFNHNIDNKFYSSELNFAYIKAKYNLKPNILFDAVYLHCKEISSLYESHIIKDNEENKKMFDLKLGDLLTSCLCLGLLPIKKT